MTDENQQNEILDFWADLGNEGWWTKNPEVDEEIRTRFGDLLNDAINGKLDQWAETPNGALALVIMLDQFSRNLFRGDPKSFAQDAHALEISRLSIERGLDSEVREDLKVFLYMPYEHSEKITDQKRSVWLQHSLGGRPENLKAALQHREIIERFGRFPHRNSIVGRHTTSAEQAYLDGGGFSG